MGTKRVVKRSKRMFLKRGFKQSHKEGTMDHIAHLVEKCGSLHKGPWFKSLQDIVRGFFFFLVRFCHLSIAHLEKGCFAQNREKIQDGKLLLRTPTGRKNYFNNHKSLDYSKGVANLVIQPKKGSARWQKTWCKNQKTPRGA